jgi:hypothetical protein
MNFRILIMTFLAISFSITASLGKPPEDDFDRLDGKGRSGKKVDVIEWEGNLEIHVYPKGSLLGLALKLDESQKGKKVMVIGYRFNNSPNEHLIRRALVSIPFYPGFKAFKDPSADDYDKIIISNNGLSGQVLAFKLDPEPKTLYPEGHPALEKKEDSGPRIPASRQSEKKLAPKSPDEEDGSIQHFNW